MKIRFLNLALVFVSASSVSFSSWAAATSTSTSTPPTTKNIPSQNPCLDFISLQKEIQSTLANSNMAAKTEAVILQTDAIETDYNGPSLAGFEIINSESGSVTLGVAEINSSRKDIEVTMQSVFALNAQAVLDIHWAIGEPIDTDNNSLPYLVVRVLSHKNIDEILVISTTENSKIVGRYPTPRVFDQWDYKVSTISGISSLVPVGGSISYRPLNP